MSTTNWKTLEDYNLMISNTGQIIDVTTKLELKQYTNNCGYKYIVINNSKRQHLLVHRLVALAFIPNPNNLSDVNHIDENKLNNNVDNLEWLSHKDNCRHSAHKHQWSDKQKMDVVITAFIKNLFPVLESQQLKTKGPIILDGVHYKNRKEACEKLNYSKARISQMINNENRGCQMSGIKYYWNHLDSTIVNT